MTTNLVVAANKVDDVTGCVGQYSDGAALYESSQRVVDIHLSVWNGEHHVNSLLGNLLRQLTYRRVVLQSFQAVSRWCGGVVVTDSHVRSYGGGRGGGQLSPNSCLAPRLVPYFTPCINRSPLHNVV